MPSAVQLSEKGSASWRTSAPTTYQRRTPMLELPRRSVGGVWYGPFILFTKWKWRCAGKKCRGLVAYMKVGRTWYRWDAEPESSYTREFYEEICSNPASTRRRRGPLPGIPFRRGWVYSYPKYCGAIKNATRLRQEGLRMFQHAITAFRAGGEQSEQTVPDPFTGGAAQQGNGASDPDEGFGIDWQKWLVPAGLLGGAVYLYQTGRIG
jgi:hypothetical protein